MTLRHGWAVPVLLGVLGCDKLSSTAEKQVSHHSASATAGKGLALPEPRIETPTEVTIEPDSSKTVRLDAQAITNGQVTVQVTLSSPSTGQQIGSTTRFAVDLQAQWETVGLIVFAALGLVFAVGIARNIVLRRRKAGRAGAEDADADQPAG